MVNIITLVGSITRARAVFANIVWRSRGDRARRTYFRIRHELMFADGTHPKITAKIENSEARA